MLKTSVHSMYGTTRLDKKADYFSIYRIYGRGGDIARSRGRKKSSVTKLVPLHEAPPLRWILDEVERFSRFAIVYIITSSFHVSRKKDSEGVASSLNFTDTVKLSTS